MLGFSEKHISFKTKNSKWRNIVIRTSYTCNSHWLNSACDADLVFVLTSVLEPHTCLDLECLCSLELGLTLEEEFFFIWCALVIYQKKFKSQSGFYETLFNPLTPKGDWQLISPHNISPKSNIKVMRIREMINNQRTLDC